MWSIFKDENEYNEKAIIGFISFALMCVFGIVDLVMGIIGIELMVNDYIYNSFVWVTLGSFGIAGAEKVYKNHKKPSIINMITTDHCQNFIAKPNISNSILILFYFPSYIY